MKNKLIRLVGAIWRETIKRVPYILLVLGCILIYQFIRLNIQTAEGVRLAKQTSDSNQILLNKISELSEDNKKLSQDNKNLTEQSNRLAEQSNHYLDCIAKVFAKYTRDYLPIVDINLNTCSAQNIYTKQIVPLSPIQPTPAPTPSPQDKNNDKSQKPVATLLTWLGSILQI